MGRWNDPVLDHLLARDPLEPVERDWAIVVPGEPFPEARAARRAITVARWEICSTGSRGKTTSISPGSSTKTSFPTGPRASLPAWSRGMAPAVSLSTTDRATW